MAKPTFHSKITKSRKRGGKSAPPLKASMKRTAKRGRQAPGTPRPAARLAKATPKATPKAAPKTAPKTAAPKTAAPKTAAPKTATPKPKTPKAAPIPGVEGPPVQAGPATTLDYDVWGADPPAQTPLWNPGDPAPTLDPDQPGQLERDYEFGNITPATPYVDIPGPGAAPGQMVSDPGYMPPPPALSEQEMDDLVTSVKAKQEAQHTAAAQFVPARVPPVPKATGVLPPGEAISAPGAVPPLQASITPVESAVGAAPFFGAEQAPPSLPGIAAPDLPPSPMIPFDELALGGGQTGGQFGPSPYMEVPRDPYRWQPAVRGGYDYGSAFGKTPDISELEDFYMQGGRSPDRRAYARAGYPDMEEGRVRPEEAGLSREQILRQRMQTAALQEIYGR